MCLKCPPRFPEMAGAVIENLSNRKLSFILLALFAAQIVFFYVGARYAPVPTSSMEYEMSRCEDPTHGQSNEWFHIRPMKCRGIEDLSEFPMSYDLRDIVFVAQMPHIRENRELKFSPWFQFLLGLLQANIEYNEHFQYGEGAKLLLEVRLGYRSKSDEEWKEYLSTNVSRTLSCFLEPEKRKPGMDYNCETLDLFELGSNPHPFYLLNIRIPVDAEACQRDANSPNCRIGKLTGLNVITIHQNGGFTMVWLWLKTLLAPAALIATVWYWNRVSALSRAPLLLEQAILSLGISIAIIDVPIEWLSLIWRTPFLLLLTDIRQGLFYFVLFSFWLIFAGEHLIDDTSRNNLSSYRWNLSLMVLSSFSLLVYDLCERGMQIADPFHSIWATDTGTTIAYTTLYVGSFCGVVYFFFLFYKIWMVWTTIRRKREAQLYRLCENRRLKVEAIIYRFKFLMLFTLLCAALTIFSYIMKQQGEADMHGDDADSGLLAHSTSAFFTGTFGMWNIYVLLLLAMYAPSHKHYQGTEALVDEHEVLMDGSRTESNAMTTFLKNNTE